MEQDRRRVEEDLRGIVTGDVLCDDASRGLYATDGSLCEVWPLAVLIGSACFGSIGFASYAAATKPDACFDKRRRASLLKN